MNLLSVLNFFKGIGIKVWGYVLIVMLVLGILQKIYKAGGNAKDVQDLNNTLDQVRKRDTNDDLVDSISDDDIIARLRKNGWFRD